MRGMPRSPRPSGGAMPDLHARPESSSTRSGARSRKPRVHPMSGPLTGIRVVELGVWVAGPSAGGVMADWGATVVKIEPPEGDPFRGLYLTAAGVELPANPPFELDNRGKRSIVLDLRKPEAHEIALRLIDGADVFVTNLRRAALARLGLEWDALSARNPRLVY